MKSKTFLPKTIVLLVYLLFSQIDLIGQICDADNPAEFIACIEDPATTTINITGGMGYEVDLTSVMTPSLSGITINLNGNALTLKGNVAVNAATSFVSGTGTLILKNDRDESVSFTDMGGSPPFDIDDLNTALGLLPGGGTLHAVAISIGASVLPITLSQFSASNLNNQISLTWQTASELNNAHFIIETSTQGEVFNRIGEIAGAGTTTEPHDYQFTHHTPSAGVNYYRLKQVDFDGTFAYSKVIAINAPGSNDIFAFPNPAKDKITLQYDYSKGTGNVQLYDALGRRLNASIGGYAGNYEVKLPDGLAKGTYWLKVERGGKVQTVPVVKE